MNGYLRKPHARCSAMHKYIMLIQNNVNPSTSTFSLRLLILSCMQYNSNILYIYIIISINALLFSIVVIYLTKIATDLLSITWLYSVLKCRNKKKQIDMHKLFSLLPIMGVLITRFSQLQFYSNKHKRVFIHTLTVSVFQPKIGNVILIRRGAFNGSEKVIS